MHCMFQTTIPPSSSEFMPHITEWTTAEISEGSVAFRNEPALITSLSLLAVEDHPE